MCLTWWVAKEVHRLPPAQFIYSECIWNEKIKKNTFFFCSFLAGQRENRPLDKFQLTFPLRTNYMYAKVKKSLPEMYALTVCMWLKSNASPGVGTPFSYAVPGQANELVLIEWGNNPMEILINDKAGPKTQGWMFKSADSFLVFCSIIIIIFLSPPPPTSSIYRWQSCLFLSMTASGTTSAWPGPPATEFGRLFRTESRGAAARIWLRTIPSNHRGCSSSARNRCAH